MGVITVYMSKDGTSPCLVLLDGSVRGGDHIGDEAVFSAALFLAAAQSVNSLNWKAASRNINGIIFLFFLFSHYQSTAGGDLSMLFPITCWF